MVTVGKHPAVFTDSIVDALEAIIPEVAPSWHIIHDPFAGVGLKLGKLSDKLGYKFSGTDLEDWAGKDSRVSIGDSTDTFTYPKTDFVVVTSPCLAHGQRVLRDDLRWVPVQDIKVGDRLVSFDEFPTALPGKTHQRRRWQLGEVTHSTPQPAEVVSVELSNGEHVVCTLNHPWLCERWPNSTSTGTKWVEASDLVGEVVLRQMPTWDDPYSYEAGWLAGMYDGEGTFAHGERTSLKLSIIQNPGPVLDLVKERLDVEKFNWTGYERDDGCEILYINGGVTGAMEALGRIRPVRLLDRWTTTGSLWGRCVVQGAERIRVLSVTPLGKRMIQGVTTTTGTYIGEGYLHHNTYNNGVNDHFGPKDTSTRLTYRVRAGHDLHPNNTGRWSGRGSKKGEAEYWRITRECVKHWPKVVVVNVKDSVRSTWEGGVYPLVRLWVELLEEFGYEVREEQVVCPGWRNGTNRDARIDTESILVGTRR